MSDLFRKSLRYAESLDADLILILSAKYGLLRLDDVVAPYDETLNRMPAAQRKIWAQQVLAQLESVTDLDRDEFILLAGARYREHLLPHLAHTRIPMERLRIGQQLRFLTEELRR